MELDQEVASSATSKTGNTDRTVKRNYQLFHGLVVNRLANMLRNLGTFSQTQDEWRSFGINSQSQLDREVALFKTVLTKAFDLAIEAGKTSRGENPLFWNLRNAFIRFDSLGLDRELKYAFQTFLMRARFPKAVNELHMAISDLRFPYEWYPLTRMLQRTVHLHVGPTNSGKTYNALKALENARSGIYAGPLRLLAHETFSRFTAKQKPCALVTGEEVRIPADSDTWFHSCTVEMCPLNIRVDVAVIDEIQMINSDDRGWAWTQAFLGVQAKEVHLCGEERVVPLIEDLCARIGEKLIIHRYERLNPLHVMDESLKGDFRNLRKGDAVVAFSRVNIHQIKAGIEKATNRRCAIVYGSLPPETRASQAALFNEPDNDYDFLVASDAIGMGLNLEVKRVIFDSSNKFDGTSFRPLSVPEVRQIGGRAGRYRTAAKEASGDTSAPTSAGLVTTFEDEDLAYVADCFTREPPPITTAGLFPPSHIIERFHSLFPPRTPTSFVLARLREMSRLSPRFHLCDFSDAMEIAEIIQEFDLSVSDRCIFLNVPINLRDNKQILALRAFAKCVAELGSGNLLDFPEINLEILESQPPRTPQEQIKYLHDLESVHHTITMYLWLSYRYQGVFQSQSLAFKVKSMVEEKISAHLEKLTFIQEAQRVRRERMRRMAAQSEEKERSLLLEEEEEEGLPVHHEEQVGGFEGEEELFDGDLEDAEVEEGLVGEEGEEVEGSEESAEGEEVEGDKVKQKEAVEGEKKE
jgi:ATP-dependent RNA helicase SUPV3L1/SUV3